MRFTRLFSLGLVSVATAISASGQDTNASMKAALPLSLDECIRLAVKDNLTLQVGDRVAIGETVDLDVRSAGRLGVAEAAYVAEAALGYYDPVFRASAGQRYQRRPFQFEDELGLFISPGTRWNEDFSVSLGGVLPTGTRYELLGTMNRLSGTRVDTDPDSGTFLEELNLSWQYTSDARIRVTQPLLRDFWIDSGRLNIKLRRTDLRITEHSFRLLTMDIIHRVALAYYDLIAARDQVKTREKALELAKQLVSENRKKVEVGTIAPLDARQSESREATARADLIEAHFAADEAENLLKGLITHDFATAQRLVIQPTEKLVPTYQAFDVNDAWRNGLENRPDYLLEKEIIERRRIELVYRKNQLFPALDLVGTYGRNGVSTSTLDSLDAIADNRTPYYGGAVVLSFPFTFKSDRADYKRTEIQHKSAILSLKRREDIVLQEIDTAVKQVRSAYEKTESTRAARKFAEEALDAEQKQFDVGRTTSFQVLQFQKDLTDAAASEISAAAEYNKALHELYFKEGTTLRRNKVDIEIK